MKQYLQAPLIAILRGLEPENALNVAQILYDAGFRILEIPLNSPEPLISIEKIRKTFDGKIIIGAGTVLNTNAVNNVADAGGQIILSPNCNSQVIQETKKRNMFSFPGVFSPSEAFTAIENGADGLKFFPCELLQPNIIKAYKAVLPKDIATIAVGGINNDNMKDFLKVGISGFGLGSSLFRPQMSMEDIRKNANKVINVWSSIKKIKT
ncbi:MAG: 2-dehydro-3-deoxy-6-phosphogalactonate aldolase [Alphaproteobacteria bacterium]